MLLMRNSAYITEKINPYADGFVWNPFSPNTAALAALRTPQEFRRSAELIEKKAPDKLKLVKMGPYEGEQKMEWLGLVDAWMNGGGDGVVAVNTYPVPSDIVPSKKWGYGSAGISGSFLKVYRRYAIRDCRQAFPDAVIIATDGIDSGEDAWLTIEAGADALEGYTPYTFHGLGLMLEMADFISEKIYEHGYESLAEYQSYHRHGHHHRHINKGGTVKLRE